MVRGFVGAVLVGRHHRAHGYALYQEAASTCPGLPWAVLAAIGTVESEQWTVGPSGVHSGANPAGAEAPMQFEPATFA